MFDQRLFDGCVKLAPGEELNETTVSLPASGGVCLFAGIEDQPILLVYGGNCRNLVRRRLADEDEAPSRRRGRLRPITACVWYRRAWSAFETQYAYMQIARAIYPDSYAELTRRAKAWFISLAARNGYRYLTVTDSVKGDLNDHWGPFATRKSAGSCLEILQDVFDLCRCPENLARAPKATPCAYAQMNRCAVFCDGSSSQDLCNELVGQAVKCLDEPAESAAKMERQMKASADARQYESAEGWKSKAGRVRKLCAEAFAWVRRLDRFYIFSFQPGPPMKEPKQRGRKSTVSTFVIGPGRVSQLEPFELDHAADRCRAALDHLRLLQMQSGCSGLSDEQQELLAWASGFLRGKSRPKGLYLAPEDNLDAELLAKRVTEHFAKSREQVSGSHGKRRLDSLSLAEQEIEDNRNNRQ